MTNYIETSHIQAVAIGGRFRNSLPDEEVKFILAGSSTERHVPSSWQRRTYSILVG